MVTKYHLEGSKIVFEDRNGTMLYYIYNRDELIGLKYNNNTYYYHKNIFRDIIGILYSNYNEVVTYEYDSWGAISSIVDNSGINLGTINPFRYRSYYYDEETQFYYLNSRYYSNNLRRFINIDNIITGQGILGCNIQIYCGNNPVNRIENGNFWLRVGLMIACGAISAGAKLIENLATGEKDVKKGVLAAGITGFIAGSFAVPTMALTKVQNILVQLSLGVIEATINTIMYKQSIPQYFEEITINGINNITTEFASNDFIPVDEKWSSSNKLLNNNYTKIIINQLVDSIVLTASTIIQKNNSKDFSSAKTKTLQTNYKKKIDNYLTSQKKPYYSPYSNKIKILYNDPIAKICRIVYLT